MSSPRIPMLPDEAVRGALSPQPERLSRFSSGARGFLRDLAWFGLAAVVAALIYANRANPHAIFQLQRAIGSVTPIVGGLVLTIVPPRWRHPRRHRIYIGIGFMLCSLVGNAPGDTKLILTDGWLNIATPVGLIFILIGILGRVRGQLLIAARAFIEAVMVGSCLTVAGWQFLFQRSVPTNAVRATVIELFVCGCVVGLAGLAWMQRRDPGLSIASAGSSALIAAHMYQQFLTYHGHSQHWIPAAVSCFGWAVVMTGMHRLGPYMQRPGSRAEAVSEGRTLVFLSMVTVGSICGLIYLLIVTPLRMDQPTWICIITFIIAIWLRELVRARQAINLIAQLELVATRDPLTGLGNLRNLDDIIIRSSEAATSRRGSSRRVLSRRQLSAMTVDINRFKDINDLLGPATADLLLRTTADLLTGLTSHLDAHVFRTAGNEFLVLVTGRAEHMDTLATRLPGALAEAAATVPGLGRLPVTAAVGVAHHALDAVVTEDSLRLLARHSTQAMRQAKLAGRAFDTYDETLAAAQRRNWQIESVLRERLAHGKGVDVHYQPIISLASGRLTSVEALARWCDPRVGDVSPTEFIAVAERSGLIERLGIQIMRDALLGARDSGLLEAGGEVAVNVSALQLRAPDFVPEVRDLLDELLVPRHQLVIEVTESVFVSNNDPAVRALNELHHEGIPVVLDDFGTGYSSLSYLTRLPVEGLKIDRSITIDLDNTKTHAIASSIAQIARRLDLQVVVEGVENAKQEQQVLGLGLNRVQGWRYSRAVDVGALSALINLTHLPEQVSLLNVSKDAPHPG